MAFAERVATEIRPALDAEQSYAVPLGAVICRNTFGIDTEELTSNLKLRRKVIEQKHEAGLTSLYEKLESSTEPGVIRFDDTTYLAILPSQDSTGGES